MFKPIKKIIFLYCIFNISILFPSIQKPISIKKRIELITKSIPGTFGVAAFHIEKNKLIEFNGKQRFPMASTYKLPIALYCLSLVEKGKFNLQNKHTVTPYDLRRWCFIKSNQKISIAQLIQLMLEKSDNATSDIILKMVGGGKAVTQWLRQHKINNMNIDRSILKMLSDYSGVKNLGNENYCTVAKDWRLLKNVNQKDKSIALNKFYIDKRDTTTPISMVNLLNQLYKGKLVTPTSKQFLLKSMFNCRYRKNRITRFLPNGTKLWHKTGTMDGIISDVGIIKLPNKEHIIFAIYTNKSIILKNKRELGMSKIAKTLFDHFS